MLSILTITINYLIFNILLFKLYCINYIIFTSERCKNFILYVMLIYFYIQEYVLSTFI